MSHIDKASETENLLSSILNPLCMTVEALERFLEAQSPLFGHYKSLQALELESRDLREMKTKLDNMIHYWKALQKRVSRAPPNFTSINKFSWIKR